MSLQGEGFEDVATCDRLLADLDRGREELDPRTVVVVDEAGMVGSRKLGRLLEHAHQARARWCWLGMTGKLAAIDAGGFAPCGFASGPATDGEPPPAAGLGTRGPGAGPVGVGEEAVAAYRAHDRVVAADSKPAATSRLQDWWAAWQDAEPDPARRSSCWPPAGSRSTG